ncbi:GNAT family N-acetyltransferase [Dyadobacter fermentans]|uniref:GCN5-related N-acetyltransferase n=1 Tax=Dyadobacter fermentans (strain ATCC 700827 / DSM 18053 / CIP 107007 / KCTC 52180 / NS114) TaxID=471854 RepID=C6VRZ9_DYAFD|nr:GNAT family N-acetyltransferase [Dyadobacter fermentans]ACT94520.1 GCN5-related N-acetyltransferase [Dyadobacter fermentans DSM 18053]
MYQIIRTNSEHPGFRVLTNELDDELCRIYNTNKADYEAYNRISGLTTVLLAYENGLAIACGCFKTFDADRIELKRMFVKPAFRGKGIASAMVAELEKWAAELGYQSAILETGIGQPEAIALYRKLGYHDIPHFGEFPEESRSVCLGKSLT